MQVNGSHAPVSPCSLLKTHICNWLVGQLRPVRVRNRLNQCLLYHLARGRPHQNLKVCILHIKNFMLLHDYIPHSVSGQDPHTLYENIIFLILELYIYSLVVKSVGSGVKLPQFKFQLHNLQPILSNASQFPHPYNRNNNIIYHIWLL